MAIDGENKGAGDTHAYDRQRDALAVGQVRSGDPDAFGRLYDAWSERVFNVAVRIVRDHDTAAEITQETFLAAWNKLDTLADPASFGGWLLRIARNSALKRAEREARSSPVDTTVMTRIEERDSVGASGPAGFDVTSRLAQIDEPSVVAADAEIVALVRQVVGVLSDRDAEVLDLQLRHSLTPAEIGAVLDLNRNAANQLCHRVRTRFADAFGARMLWGSGATKCRGLATELRGAGVVAFSSDAVSIANRHAASCEQCTRERATRLSPASLFAATPLVAFTGILRSRVAAGLANSGVPMSGSDALAGVPNQPATPNLPSSHPTALPAARPPVGIPASAPTVPQPPEARSTGAASVTGGRPSRAANRRARASVAAALTVAAVVALLAMWSGFGNDSSRNGARPAPDASSSSVARSASTSSDTAAATTVLTPATGAAASTADPTQTNPSNAPSSQAPATNSTTTVTTIAMPTVEQMSLIPDTPQPSVWPTASGPVFTWSTTGAAAVTVRTWYGDSVRATQMVSTMAVEASGSMAICPGSHPTATSCSAAPGWYYVELLLTDTDGASITSIDQPSFQVLAPIIP